MTCVTRKAVKAGDEITGYYGNYLSSQKDWINDMVNKYDPQRKLVEKTVEEGKSKPLNWKIE